MSRSLLRRGGVLLLGAVMAVTGLASPALAEATGAVTGQLTDNGAPVTGGSVSLYGDDVDYSGWASLDSDGHYAFETVPAGHYRVQFQPWNAPTQYAVGKTDWSSANLFAVTAGGTTVVNDELLPTGTITGRLVDRSGNAVPFAYVSANTVDYTGSGSSSTDPDGYFSMRVFPGSYVVRFDTSDFGQYAYGTLNHDEAAVFVVAADTTITVNDTLLGTGSVAGRFTDASGQPMAGVDVSVTNGGFWGMTQTDGDGNYRLDRIPAGSGYTVQFTNWSVGFMQFAYGQSYEDSAARFAVTEDQVTTVNDSQLPTGSVHLTAVDSRTGQPVSDFSASVGNAPNDSTSTGEITFPVVAIGQQDLQVYAEGYSSSYTQVTVVANQQLDVVVKLAPLTRITATVVDSATGLPLAGVCLAPTLADQVRMPDGCRDGVSNENGKVSAYVYSGAGTYKLFAWPEQAEGYGAQWVGPKGGTGDVRHALEFTVDAGDQVTAPAIRMDRAGVITGQVFAPDGSTLSDGAVRVANEYFNTASNWAVFPIGEEGRYRIDKLGPYQWPLLFQIYGYAIQWSGGTGNLNQADRIQVVAGGTTTYDYRLEAGVTVTVKTAGATDNFVVALNADTGDIVGLWWAPDISQGATAQVIGGQEIKFQYYAGGVEYVGGDDFASATVYDVPKRKNTTIELPIG